jgi:hypothetical protein
VNEGRFDREEVAGLIRRLAPEELIRRFQLGDLESLEDRRYFVEAELERALTDAEWQAALDFLKTDQRFLPPNLTHSLLKDRPEAPL